MGGGLHFLCKQTYYRIAELLQNITIKCIKSILENNIKKYLISTNIMQRGVGNINPLKMAKCIRELERIKGIRNGSANEKGNNRIGDEQNVPHQTNQSDLAEELHITPQHLRRFKSLLNLIPELQDLVETGELKASIGYTVLSK